VPGCPLGPAPLREVGGGRGGNLPAEFICAHVDRPNGFPPRRAGRMHVLHGGRQLRVAQVGACVDGRRAGKKTVVERIGIGQPRGVALVVRGHRRIGLVGDVARGPEGAPLWAREDVVPDDHRGAQAAASVNKQRLVLPRCVGEGVVDHVELPAWRPAGRALFKVRNRGIILRFHALLNDVSDHVRGAAVGQVQLEASVSPGFFGQPVVQDVVHRRT